MSHTIVVSNDSDSNLLEPGLAFSADGSKFAIVTNNRRVSVWDIRSQVPLKTFVDSEVPTFGIPFPVNYLQFSGNLGKEVLVFVEVCLMFTF